ncbi:MAG: rhodanese-like domain-containing protein [Methanomicrobiales archaeon]|nr:rhodanese-like domain-containing protein [Methanomicrobiales archaeon]
MANPYFPLAIGCIVMAVLIGGCSSAGTAPDQIARSVSPIEASSLMEEMGQRPEFVTIDVRRADEFADGHISSAVNIDSKSFPDHIAGLDPDGAYLIYCQRGARSASVCDMMRNAGFTEMYEIEGGLSAWEAAGLPVEQG